MSNPNMPLSRLDIPAKGGLWRLTQKIKGAQGRRRAAEHLLGLVADPDAQGEIRARMRTLVDLGLWNDIGWPNDDGGDRIDFLLRRWLGRSLQRASEYGRTDPAMVHMAIEGGVDPNFSEENRRDDSLATTFARTGQIDCLMVILDAGGNLRYRDTCNDTVLHLLIERACNKDWMARQDRDRILGGIEQLLDRGQDINDFGWPRTFSGGGPAIKGAIEAGDLEIVQWMLDRGAQLDIADEHGEFPLHWMATSSSRNFGLDQQQTFDLLDCLINHGAQIDARNSRGETPLWRAAAWRNDTVAQWLVEQGADHKINPHTHQDPDGREHPGVPGRALLELLVKEHRADSRWAMTTAKKILENNPEALNTPGPGGKTLADEISSKPNSHWMALLEEQRLEQATGPAHARRPGSRL